MDEIIVPTLDTSFYSDENLPSVNCYITDCIEFKNLLSNDKSNNLLSLFCLNIRSIRNKFSSLCDLLASLTLCFSIIAITETWLTCDIDNVFSLNGYNQFNLYRLS